MITLMVIKNLLLFLLGFLFSSIIFSLLVAYHLHKSVQVDLSNNDVSFIEDRATGAIYWNDFTSYKTALDAWYISLYRRFVGSSKDVCYKNNNRAKLLFLITPIVLLVVLILVLILSLMIQTI